MKVLQFLILSAAAVVLSGCQKQTGPETSGPDGKGPAITLEGRVAPDSKVSDTSFDNGDEIGLTVVGWSGEEPAALSDYRDEDNVRYVYEDGLFSALSTACYPNSEDKVTLWAYYPFTYGGGSGYVPRRTMRVISRLRIIWWLKHLEFLLLMRPFPWNSVISWPKCV